MENWFSFKNTVSLIKKDIYRMSRGMNKNYLLTKMIVKWKYPWINSIVLYRWAHFLRAKKFTRYTLYPFIKILKSRADIKYGIDIHVTAKIGHGLRIAHPGGTVFSPGLIVGKNLTIAQGCIFGWVNRGPHKGIPKEVGDNVYIGPGAKILGNVTIGDNVVIGANTVVTKDIPSNATVFGVPGRIVATDNAAEDHINFKV